MTTDLPRVSNCTADPPHGFYSCLTRALFIKDLATFVGVEGNPLAIGRDVRPDNTEPAVPHALFQANFNASHEVAEYGVTANGERFLVAEPTSRSEHAMTFVFNWTPR